MTISVVLPCFNEEANIGNTIKDVSSWMQHASMEGEIIVVNDGSRDGTAALLEHLRESMPMLRIVHHEKNQGYGVAVRSGCDASTKDIIVFMDSDGQFHAEDIALLLASIDQFEVVTGRRRHRADSFVRNTYGKVLGLLNLAVFGLWVRDVNCGLKAFRKSTWPKIRPVHGVEKLFNTELFMRLKQQGIPWATIDVPHYPRTAGAQTGGSPRVILRMFRELFALKRSLRHIEPVVAMQLGDSI
jgi:dolichol-phosphate mannosyltransferase